MGKVKKDKLWNKDFIILFFANIVATVGFQMLHPNMAGYAASIGAKEATLGAVTALFSMAALLARPFSGRAADRFDCKKAAIFSLLGTAVAMVVYTLSNSFEMLLAARFIHGVFFGFNSTLTMAMASRVLPDSRMGSGMGIFSLGVIFAMSFGPNIGIYTLDNYGFNSLFIVAAVAPLLAAAMILFIDKQEPITGKTGKKANTMPFLKTFFAPEAMGPSTIAMLNTMAMGAINTFIVIHGKNKGVEGIGIYFMVNSATVVAVRPLFSYLMDRV